MNVVLEALSDIASAFLLQTRKVRLAARGNDAEADLEASYWISSGTYGS